LPIAEQHRHADLLTQPHLRGRANAGAL
jgi:hypothetical protein